VGCRKSIRTQRWPYRTGYDPPPSMLLCVPYVGLPAPHDLALTPSRRHGRATDTGGQRLHPDIFGVSTTWRYAGQIQPAGATPSRFNELESPSAHMAFKEARVHAHVLSDATPIPAWAG